LKDRENTYVNRFLALYPFGICDILIVYNIFFMTEITHFAKTNFRNQETVFGIKTDDRRRHMYIIGKTGMGKTNLLEHLVIQDIRNGHGVAYVDPHGDTAEKLIKMIPPERINDVIYFNPADQEFPIAFNVMEKVGPEYRHLVASGLVGVFKKLWADSWGPRLEYILRNAILALLEYPGSTLLGVMRILVDKKYRSRVVDKITDPVVRSFWVDEFTKWNDRVLQEVVAPIQNKVGQFLSTALIRNIVGQTKSSFSIRETMDSKKILILNLAKGRIGEDNSALLGAMMITKIQMAAMARVDIAESERKDFYLYVDEFQNFATESFANILSEARKYRLNLILANQYVNQIDEVVRDSIFGNAGTIISFRVGAVDAEFLEKEYEPVFYINDIVNLPKYHIYLKLMIDGIAGDAFSAKTLPPIEEEEIEDTSEKTIRVSRERYAFSRAEVEKKINQWSGIVDVDVERASSSDRAQRYETKSPAKARIVERVEEKVQPQATQKDTRKLFQAKCDTCEIDIQVPFEPDGSRPTFCKDCLKDYQRAIAKKQDQSKKLNEDDKDAPKNLRQRKRYSPKLEKTVEPMVHKTDVPLKLSQFQHIAPKKFKNKKTGINLNEVRGLIRKQQDNSKQEVSQDQQEK